MEVADIVIKTEIDNSELDKGLKETQNISEENARRIEEANKRTADAKKQIEEANKAIAQSEQEIVEAEEEIASISEENARQELAQQMTQQISTQLNNIKKTIIGITKKVLVWGLAMIGIRGIFSMISNSMSVISQHDKQLASDIQYMKNALAYVLEPVVRRIVDLMKQLLFYAQYLIYKWTGKNIFENANKSLQSANKEAKKLAKQLAGFDEMNILQDNSGGGGATTPSFDLSKIPEMEVPKWLVTIEKIGQWIIDNWEEVVFALLLTKLFIDLITGNWVAFALDLIGLLIVGFLSIKKSVKEIIENLKIMWDDFVEDFELAWSMITFWVKDKVDEIKKNWDDMIVKIGNKIDDVINGAKETFNNFYNAVKDVVDGIVMIFKGDFKGGLEKVFNGLKTIFLIPINAFISGFNKLIKGLNKFKIDIPEWLGGGKLSFNIPLIPKLAKGGIINMPGRGIPIGNAIGGERGREGVIPLTDSQQMELLGQAIGKYINVNANIPIYVGNRQIAREIRKINAEDDFAYNG